jgi:amino acid permease
MKFWISIAVVLCGIVAAYVVFGGSLFDTIASLGDN